MASQENDWIEWAGGKCPVADHALVHVRHRAGTVSDGTADEFQWENAYDDRHADIIEYRVVSA